MVFLIFSANCLRNSGSAVLDVMRQTTEPETAKPEFRKQLAEKIKDTMNEMLEKLEDFGGIEEVFFTSFVMQ